MAVRLAREHVASVAFVVFDFDGVMTDNRVLVAEDGRESVFCSRADGLGVQMLLRAGVGCLVLSTETNPVVSARAAKLGVECVQGLGDAKGEALRGILRDRTLDRPRWPTSATTSTTSSASGRLGSRSAWPTPGPPSGVRRASSPPAGAATAPFARSATSFWRPASAPEPVLDAPVPRD